MDKNAFVEVLVSRWEAANPQWSTRSRRTTIRKLRRQACALASCGLASSFTHLWSFHNLLPPRDLGGVTAVHAPGKGLLTLDLTVIPETFS